MSDTIKSVELEDIGNYGTRTNSLNYSSNSIVRDGIEDFDFDLIDVSSETTSADLNSEIRLEGKYVDDSGKSFDADYYYSNDGTYNVSYKDGYKDIQIKFHVDGSKMNSEVRYEDFSSNCEVKEITSYEADGGVQESIYNDGNLISNKITGRDGTVTSLKYSGNRITSEKVVNPDGSLQEIIYEKNDNFGKEVITKDVSGNEVRSKYDFTGQKIQDEFINSSGITTEIREYNSGNLSKAVLNNEFGEKTEERIYMDGKVRQINLSDGRVFAYEENGNLESLKVGDSLQLHYFDGRLIRVSGDNNMDIKYDEDGSLYSVLFDDAEAAKSNISFNVEKNKYAREEVQNSRGYSLSGTIKEVVFSKDSDGTASNLIVSTDGQMVSVSARSDEINIDVSGLKNYISSFDKYADGYTSI